MSGSSLEDQELAVEAELVLNKWAAAVGIQQRRAADAMSAMLPESIWRDRLQLEVELDLYIVALVRLRAVALALVKAGWQDARQHLDEFNEAVPHLTAVRDATEHLEDYLRGKGRRRPGGVTPGGPAVIQLSMSDRGVSQIDLLRTWSGYELHLGSAAVAARRLTLELEAIIRLRLPQEGHLGR